MKARIVDKQHHVVIAAAVLSPLIVGLLTLGSLTIREARANTTGRTYEDGIKTKFIRTSQQVSVCLNGRRLF